MKEVRNKTNRAGRNVYQVNAESAHRNNETVKLRYNSGRHAADNAELGTWQVSSLNTERELFGSFEEAAHAFEDRTNAEPPEPNWERKKEKN